MAGLMEGLAALAALEVELAAEVGAAPLEALNDALVAILPALERRSAVELEAETQAQVEVEVDPIDPAPTARSRAGR
jgi:ribosomal protein S7